MELDHKTRRLLQHAIANTGADPERMRVTLETMLVDGDERPCLEDLVEVRDYFARVGEIALSVSSALVHGERSLYGTFPRVPVSAQRPGVPPRAVPKPLPV